jgi:inorganic pyrophosphatase
VEAVPIGRVSSYKLKTVLPRGVVFPFDFGSIPGTVADHGDPLGVLLLTTTITLVRQ